MLYDALILCAGVISAVGALVASSDISAGPVRYIRGVHGRRMEDVDSPGHVADATQRPSTRPHLGGGVAVDVGRPQPEAVGPDEIEEKRLELLPHQEPQGRPPARPEMPRVLDYWVVIVNRRWAVLSSLMIVLGTVLIGTVKEKPIFVAETTIEIILGQQNPFNLTEPMQNPSINSKSYRATQCEVLRSRILAEHVVEGLQLYRIPEFYRGRNLFRFVERNPERTPPDSQGQPDPSSDVYQNSVQHFMNSLDVTPVGDSSLVRVAFYSEDPQLSARVANKLAEAYVDQNLKSIVESFRFAEKRSRYLAEAMDNQKRTVDRIAQGSNQNDILKREIGIYNKLYEDLLNRMRETGPSVSMQSSNVRIVDPAEPPRHPVRPRVLINLILGMALGAGMGVGLAFFQEYLDDTLKTPEDVEEKLGLPSLGLVPRFAARERPSRTALVLGLPEVRAGVGACVWTSPEGIEAFRSLRTSILLSASPAPRLILITSSVGGEGKTTTAVNLGAALASLGSKVVVVDCDLRRPRIHRSMGVENSPGFVQCLTGALNLVDAIIPAPGVSNLDIIPCGPTPPNPAELLSSVISGELFRALRARYEYVLVDSPPLLSLADSRILATITDAVVLVARANHTPYYLVGRASNLLYTAGARVLGVVLNLVDIKRADYRIEYYWTYKAEYGYPAEGILRGADADAERQR